MIEIKEQWLPIRGFEGLYEISSYGNVKSLLKNIIRQPSINNSGYKVIQLSRNGKLFHFSIHRLVALHFCSNPSGLKEVNHIDENKLNNHADNLEWCDRKYNMHYNGNMLRWLRAGSENAHLKRSKRVFQYDLNGQFIREWFSARIVEKELGIRRQSIGKCCLGKYKSAGGYIWKFSL